MTLCQGRGCRFLMRPRQPNQISGQSLVGTAVTAERVSHTGEIPYTKGFRGQLRSRTFRAHLFKAARAMCLYVPKEHQGVLFCPGGVPGGLSRGAGLRVGTWIQEVWLLRSKGREGVLTRIAGGRLEPGDRERPQRAGPATEGARLSAT